MREATQCVQHIQTIYGILCTTVLSRPLDGGYCLPSLVTKLQRNCGRRTLTLISMHVAHHDGFHADAWAASVAIIALSLQSSATAVATATSPTGV